MAGTKGHSGGARERAGRKPRSVLYAAKIATAERKMALRLGDITDAMIELAVGVWVEETDEEGERRVYQKPPNFKAGLDILNRFMGRPREEAEEPEPEAEPSALDFSRLNKQELDAFQAILEKAQTGADTARTDEGGAGAA